MAGSKGGVEGGKGCPLKDIDPGSNRAISLLKRYQAADKGMIGAAPQGADEELDSILQRSMDKPSSSRHTSISTLLPLESVNGDYANGRPVQTTTVQRPELRALAKETDNSNVKSSRYRRGLEANDSDKRSLTLSSTICRCFSFVRQTLKEAR
ncbi:uncharacterized protein THITE_114656 [Thermothielavioides terrestris NRRL 8126]|uniref:Uncharacterized protein n=1 Tax=Thermothielavioides terrestris (strain ATCC 38088 / NRRL 8126) TaxID=578455 RepID=G2RCS3_THETT|nr:uncharacterized protein THITE_114656 [Thermothielavioides terrestris NRRL 8126]AEO70669.1 hypothetical protein THITE_114656 [Thermothielavioides terrestris NRRL 8126]